MLSAQRACLEQCIVQKLILYLRPLLAPILQETRRRTADRGSDLRLPQSNRWTRGRPPPAGSLPPSLARGGGGWRVPREGGRTDGRTDDLEKKYFCIVSCRSLARGELRPRN